jgi:hypothetical protein
MRTRLDTLRTNKDGELLFASYFLRELSTSQDQTVAIPLPVSFTENFRSVPEVSHRELRQIGCGR